jgi:CheY-like chemotaxis protein
MRHDLLEAAGILIVDDEMDNVRVLEQMLDEWRYRNIASTTDPGICRGDDFQNGDTTTAIGDA